MNTDERRWLKDFQRLMWLRSLLIVLAAMLCFALGLEIRPVLERWLPNLGDWIGFVKFILLPVMFAMFLWATRINPGATPVSGS